MKINFLLLFFFLIYGCTSEELELELNEEPIADIPKPEEPNTEPPIEITKPPLCDGIKQIVPIFVDKDVEVVVNVEDKCSVFMEENGLLIMEAENTKSDYGKWVFSDAPLIVKEKGATDTDTTVELKDHRGTGYLRFSGAWGNTEESSPLLYTFKIKNEGTYRLFIRNLKGLNEEGDKHNDCFVRMDGDFDIGEVDGCINTKNLDFLPSSKLNVLKENTKLFGASNEKWAPAGKLDVYGVSFKPWAVYKFKEGETYTLTITGRSSKYFIDRILLVDIHKYNFAEFSNYVNNAVQNNCE